MSIFALMRIYAILSQLYIRAKQDFCYLLINFYGRVNKKKSQFRRSVMRTRIAFLTIALLIALNGIVFAQQRTDAQIRAELQRRIQPGTNVTVSVQNGIATLSGTVPSLAQKQSVLNLARRTVGVRSIVDRITVVPAQRRSDADLVTSVRGVLVGNLSKEELAAVNITAQNGIVILSGTLTSSYPKEVAGILASWVPGVVDVRNNIVIRPSQVRTDEQILNDIQARYSKNPFIHQQRIDVNVRSGIVTLQGVVDNFLTAEQAESVARFTPGVVDVHNLIFVRAMGV